MYNCTYNIFANCSIQQSKNGYVRNRKLLKLPLYLDLRHHKKDSKNREGEREIEGWKLQREREKERRKKSGRERVEERERKKDGEREREKREKGLVMFILAKNLSL